MSKKIPSVKELILKHSHARVLVASDKPFIIGFETNGMPKFSFALTDEYVKLQHAKKYSRK